MSKIRVVELRGGKTARDLTWLKISNHQAILWYTRGIVVEIRTNNIRKMKDLLKSMSLYLKSILSLALSLQ